MMEMKAEMTDARGNSSESCLSNEAGMISRWKIQTLRPAMKSMDILIQKVISDARLTALVMNSNSPEGIINQNPFHETGNKNRDAW